MNILKNNPKSFNESKLNEKINIGFFLIGNGEWQGGLNYQRTVLSIIANKISKNIKAKVFVSEDNYDLANKAFSQFLEEPLIIDERAANAGQGTRAIKSLIVGSDKLAEDLMHENHIDIVFENARFFGRKLSIPCLSWIPDFQHRDLPYLFNFYNWCKRELGFRMQTEKSGKRQILLSSKTAQLNCENYYPASKGRTHVASFVPNINIKDIYNLSKNIKLKYDLPDKFYYLPNQFWTHKNHKAVLSALIILKKRGALNKVPPIIMSGSTHDYRSVDFYKSIMNKAKYEDLTSWFIHIGMIPHEDVLALNAISKAIINPSKFEGWSSSVEEAKALGSSMILSDIPVHKEQAPSALFFDLNDDKSLAEILYNFSQNDNSDKVNICDLEQNLKKSQDNFAKKFETAIMKTL